MGINDWGNKQTVLDRMAMAMVLSDVGKKDHLQVNSVGHNVLKLHKLQDEAEKGL